MKALTRTLLLLLFLPACSFFEDNTYLYLKSDHARDLREGMAVSVSGIEVGRVKSIELQQDLTVLSILQLNEVHSLPVDAQFSVIHTGILGATEINILPGVAPTYLQTGDTVVLSPRKAFFPDSTWTKGILDITKNWLNDGTQKDSILQELRKLNQRLEELPPSDQ